MLHHIPMPSRNFMAIAVFVAYALRGLWLGLLKIPADNVAVQAAYVLGTVAGSGARGALYGGLLWLLARGAEGFRLQNPKPWISYVSLGVYLVGAALGTLFIGAALYASIYLATEPDAGMPAVFALVSVALFYWFAGRAVSYMLGR